MAGRGGGSNTTHALLSPDPETLPMGEVSRTATGEFLGTKGLQGKPTVAPYAPLTAGPNSSLSQRYGPAIITQELVAENGLFQPKLKLTVSAASPICSDFQTFCPDWLHFGHFLCFGGIAASQLSHRIFPIYF